MYIRLFFSWVMLFIFNEMLAQNIQIEYGNTSDRKLFFYGIQVGAGIVNFNIEPSNSAISNNRNAVDFSPSIGAEINGVAGIRVSNFMQISTTPGILFSSGSITWAYLERENKIKTYFLTFPVNIKFYGSRMVNIRPMIEVGFSYARLLNSNENSSEDNSNGIFRMKSNNFLIRASAGIDIYTPYIKISPSVCYIRGLNNICVEDIDANSQWTNPIKNMYLSGLFLCIRFQ